MRDVKEYFITDDNRNDHIGSDDITPGMLDKLRKHAIADYEYSTIEVRDRKSGRVIQVIKPSEDSPRFGC